jgi:hypothetical protein
MRFRRPKKKARYVCEACDIKCESYLKTKIPKFKPKKYYKIPAHEQIDPEKLFVYCENYDLISFINKKQNKRYISADYILNKLPYREQL